jgi:hypothetical protein
MSLVLYRTPAVIFDIFPTYAEIVILKLENESDNMKAYKKEC